MEDRLERVEDLGAGAQPLGEAGRPHGHHHELLEVHLVVRVRAAVQHVHHRHGQHVGRLAAEVAPQRRAGLGRRGLGRGERHAQDRVGAQPALVRGAVELDHGGVQRRAGRSRRGRARARRSRRSRSTPPGPRPCRSSARRRRAARPPRTRRWTRPRAPPRGRQRRMPAPRRPRPSDCRGCPRSAARAPPGCRSTCLLDLSLCSRPPLRGGSAQDPRRTSTASRTAASSLPPGTSSGSGSSCPALRFSTFFA